MKELINFYRGRRVFLTGHTGFKGAWMCAVLKRLGATVCGYALRPPTNPSLFELCGAGRGIRSAVGDVRDLAALESTVREFSPDVAIHMAARSLVREGYSDPVGTYSTNVMGTVHFLQALRGCETVGSIVNVTTDKVYKNPERGAALREESVLDGNDPYSNSKSCSELVTGAYVRAFFAEKGVPVSTCRAGNAIGGGDFSPDRILPDCVRAAAAGKAIRVRNPHSVRPYQHVLEPIFAYLTIAMRQYAQPDLAGCYNIGPKAEGCISTGELAELFCTAWGGGARWENAPSRSAPREADFLTIDSTKAERVFGWRPRWNVAAAVQKTVEWSKAWLSGGDVAAVMDRQIDEYMAQQQ